MRYKNAHILASTTNRDWMTFSTIINNILILKSICLVSNAFDRQLLNIYNSGPNLQEVHDVKAKAEKLIPLGNVHSKGWREDRQESCC